MTNIIYPLKHFIIDVYWTNQHDLYVYAEYVSPMSYRVYVRRLDTYSNEGWNYDLRLLLYSPIHGISEQISFGSSETAEKIQLLDNPFENILFEPAAFTTATTDCVLPPPSKYRQYVARMSEPNYCQIGYETFNQLFDAEIPLLPSSLYAVGIRDGTTYIYNEKYSHYYEIAPTVNFLVNILYDRLGELWNGSEQPNSRSNMRISQTMGGGHVPSQADYLDNSSTQMDMFPPAPVAAQKPQNGSYDTMMRGGGSMAQGPAPGPMAANGVLGGGFGTFF
jgi:hypothetical protein